MSGRSREVRREILDSGSPIAHHSTNQLKMHLEYDGERRLYGSRRRRKVAAGLPQPQEPSLSSEAMADQARITAVRNQLRTLMDAAFSGKATPYELERIGILTSRAGETILEETSDGHTSGVLDLRDDVAF